MVEIKNRYTGGVIYIHQGGSLSHANLRGADLSHANLSHANLFDTNLLGANLSDANLTGADLTGANLFDTNLRDANLRGADLRGADLRRADLTAANLTDANLFGQKIEKTPIQINNLIWPIIITEHHMKIGCQVHTHQEWEDFTGDELAAMDNDAFEFAEKWRSILLMMCHEHAKESK